MRPVRRVFTLVVLLAVLGQPRSLDAQSDPWRVYLPATQKCTVPTLSPLTQWFPGGTATAVANDGELWTIVVDDQLVFFTIADGGLPRTVASSGQIPTGTFWPAEVAALHVVLQGRTAWIVDGAGDLRSFTYRDGEIVGGTPIHVGSNAFSVDGDVAVVLRRVADGVDTELDVLDVSDPERPTVRATSVVSGATSGPVLMGDLVLQGSLYVVNVFDISDGAARWVTRISAPGTVFRIATEPPLAIAATGTGDWGPSGIRVLAFDPPRLLGHTEYGLPYGDPQAMDIADGHAFVAEWGRRGGLRVYDVRDPTSPRPVARHASIDRPCCARGVAGVAASNDGTVVASHWEDGVYVYRFTPGTCRNRTPRGIIGR